MYDKEMLLGYCRCEEHGDHCKSWFICKHIKTPADICFIYPWNEKDGGNLICHLGGDAHGVDDITLMCEEHAKEEGYPLFPN